MARRVLTGSWSIERVLRLACPMQFIAVPVGCGDTGARMGVVTIRCVSPDVNTFPPCCQQEDERPPTNIYPGDPSTTIPLVVSKKTRA